MMDSATLVPLLDSATLVPVLGFAGTVVLAVSAIVVAIITHKNEQGQTAESVMERTLNQRILLRDEQNSELKQDLLDALDRGRRKDELNRELRRENQELKTRVQSLEEGQREPQR